MKLTMPAFTAPPGLFHHPGPAEHNASGSSGILDLDAADASMPGSLGPLGKSKRSETMCTHTTAPSNMDLESNSRDSDSDSAHSFNEVPYCPSAAYSQPDAEMWQAAQREAHATQLEAHAQQLRLAYKQAKAAAQRVRTAGMSEMHPEMQEELRSQTMQVSSPAYQWPAHGEHPMAWVPPPFPAGGLAKTSVMLKNLPNDYTRDMILELLDEEGFEGSYDFIYLPFDFKRKAGLGYAFLNCVTPQHALRVMYGLQGFANWKAHTQKVMEVSWSHPLQGLEAHIDRYRNSPVMHPDVPQQFKPLLFKDGRRVDFPAAVKRLKAPRKIAKQLAQASSES